MIRKVSPVTEQRGLLIPFKSLCVHQMEKSLISCFHNVSGIERTSNQIPATTANNI
jgi:hypothetical protein